jgi:hypothetical protein
VGYGRASPPRVDISGGHCGGVLIAMQTMVHNTTIVTADEACAVQYDAAIVVEAGRIAAIGPTAEPPARYPTAERIDGRGKAVWTLRASSSQPVGGKPPPALRVFSSLLIRLRPTYGLERGSK